MFGDEEYPADVDDGDNLIKIASNIHEVVVKPNGEPIQFLDLAEEETSGGGEIIDQEDFQIIDSGEELTPTTTIVSLTTTTSTTQEPVTEKIPSFCLKLKFNCKLFSSHKCCRYTLPVSSSTSGKDNSAPASPSLVRVQTERIKDTKPLVVGLKENKEDEQDEEQEEIVEIPKKPRERKKSFFSKKYGKSKYSFLNKRKLKFNQSQKEAKVEEDQQSDDEEKIVKTENVEPEKEEGKKETKSKSNPAISFRQRPRTSLFGINRNPGKSGICRIINCSRSKDHFCCKDNDNEGSSTTASTTTVTTTTTTSTPTTLSTTTTSHSTTSEHEETTTMMSYELVVDEEREFAEDVEDVSDDDTVAATENTVDTTMMSYDGYTQLDEEDNTESATEITDTEEGEEVTMVSKSKSESYEETRIWYDGIDELGQFVKSQPMMTHHDENGEAVVHVYPVYRPEKEMRPAPVYIPPEESFPAFNEIDNSIDDDRHDEDRDIINEVTCEHVDCLAWPSNKCCSPHVAKKRHSVENDINDRITATIIRIVKSVRWV